ncbi:hypothetical protein [Rhodopila globiformis]|uniref:Uncharacterized protein n=1 Tax=Rhodopila globiformis TaxID=1071 RepID=A0A2S6N2B0_RHOGL|nr:hypothetical protein [Rhodopila globiformis]PPQ28749.1 hypothetical protein CCS01_23480 [Rhodopila globiformis]
MTRFLIAGALLGAVSIASSAQAETIAPDTGLQAVLGTVNVTIYYHPVAAGYQVVTTASTDQPDSVIRFVSTLAPGQDALVSVPRGVGQPALEIHLRRVGDRLEFQRPTT